MKLNSGDKVFYRHPEGSISFATVAKTPKNDEDVLLKFPFNPSEKVKCKIEHCLVIDEMVYQYGATLERVATIAMSMDKAISEEFFALKNINKQ